jgi:Zn-finger nucleic acid-binding protein
MMQCPVCSETLVLSDRNGVEIDYCPKCRGIWLDRGELDKIIERAAEHYSNKDNYDADRHKYERHPNPKHVYPDTQYRKKKSFLNDFFDFD